MSQTNGDSTILDYEINMCDVSNNPKQKNSEYKIINGGTNSLSLDANYKFFIVPGMEIELKDGINVEKDIATQILNNQKNRLTEKQVAKRNKDIEK